MSLSDDFRELAARFRRIHAETIADGLAQYHAAAASGGRLLKRWHDLGIIDLPNFHWPALRKLGDDDNVYTAFWSMFWDGFAFIVSCEHPTPPPLSKLGDSDADWRIAAENAAELARWLADYVDAMTAKTDAPGGAEPAGTQPQQAARELQAGPVGKAGIMAVDAGSLRGTVDAFRTERRRLVERWKDEERQRWPDRSKLTPTELDEPSGTNTAR